MVVKWLKRASSLSFEVFLFPFNYYASTWCHSTNKTKTRHANIFNVSFRYPFALLDACRVLVLKLEAFVYTKKKLLHCTTENLKLFFFNYHLQTLFSIHERLVHFTHFLPTSHCPFSFLPSVFLSCEKINFQCFCKNNIQTNQQWMTLKKKKEKSFL